MLYIVLQNDCSVQSNQTIKEKERKKNFLEQDDVSWAKNVKPNIHQ